MPANFYLEDHEAHAPYAGPRFWQHDGQALVVVDEQGNSCTVAAHDPGSLADACLHLEMHGHVISLSLPEIMYALARSCQRELMIESDRIVIGSHGTQRDSLPASFT